jgi:hypothetical protein
MLDSQNFQGFRRSEKCNEIITGAVARWGSHQYIAIWNHQRNLSAVTGTSSLKKSSFVFWFDPLSLSQWGFVYRSARICSTGQRVPWDVMSPKYQTWTYSVNLVESAGCCQLISLKVRSHGKLKRNGVKWYRLISSSPIFFFLSLSQSSIFIFSPNWFDSQLFNRKPALPFWWREISQLQYSTPFWEMKSPCP